MENQFGELQRNQFGEVYYPQITPTSFARHSSEVLYRQFFPELLSEEDHLFIVVGTDSGLFLEYLLAQPQLPLHSRYLLIDYPAALEPIQDKLTQLAQNDESQIVVASDTFDLNQIAVEYMPYLVRRNIHLMRSFAVQEAKNGTAYDTLWRHVEALYSRLIKQELISLNAKPFIDAQLHNLADNLMPMVTMRNRLEGATALILGGGPTLDGAIEWIKANQQRVLIFSAARIARRLVKEGIRPDIFVSVDPHDVSFDNSKGIFNFSDTALLAHSHHINPKILGQWPGVSAYLGERTPWHNDEAENFASPGPNVINTAMHLAFELGCSTFILSGVDMCFVGTQAFESGSDEAKSGGKFVFNEIQKVENNAGEMAQTQPMYALGREMLEAQVARYRQAKPGLQFLTLGLYSAKIEEVEYVAPADLTLEGRSIQFEIGAMIDALRLSPVQRLKKVKTVLAELKKQSKRFHEIARDAKEAVALVGNMFDPQGNEQARIVQKFLKLKKRITKAIDEDGDMLFHYEHKHFSTNFKSLVDEQAMQQNEIQEQLNGFFNAVMQAAELFHKELMTTQSMVELRINELKGENLAACIEQWQRMEQPGRAYLWKAWHSTVSEAQNSLLEAQTALFDELVNTSQTTQLANLQQKSRDLPGLFNRALEAYENKDLVEIEHTIDHLKSLDEQEGATDLNEFMLALKNDLQGAQETALQAYLSVHYAPIRHQALKRALNIATELHNDELALNLLEQLCHYSLEYMLPYASLLELLGHKALAVEVLKLYLQQNPENESVKVHYAQKLIELGETEQARVVLQAVLQATPHHQTARHLLAQI